MSVSSRKFTCGVLGATGMVGQRFINLLSSHPELVLERIGASPRSAGRYFTDACKWRLAETVPEQVKMMMIVNCVPEDFVGCDIIFSGLDSDVAGEIELAFQKKGFPVFSNAKNHRMDPKIPLVVPLVNGAHLEAVKAQKLEFNGGFVVTNANCSTTGLVVPLKALYDAFGPLKFVHVVTMQAISGAGYPGVPSMDILDNVVPFIDGEESKIEIETKKILGDFDGHAFQSLQDVAISAQCNRVPVLDGHLCCVSVKFAAESPPTIEEIEKTFMQYTSYAHEKGCHSAPQRSINVMTDPDRPQPRLDRNQFGGFAVSVGRIRKDSICDVKFVALLHNTILGAAGSSILNAELAIKMGLI